MRFENPHQQPTKFEKIGEGTQKHAYRNLEDPNSVTVAFKYEWTNEEVKAMFYIQKIAHIIFPDETVNVHQVGRVLNEDGDSSSYARSQYVSAENDPTHQRMQTILSENDGSAWDLNKKDSKEMDEYYKQSRQDKRVRMFLHKYAKAGLENRLAPFGRQDRIELGDGKFKYVDLAVPWNIDEDDKNHKELLFDPEKLEQAINELPELTRKKAQVYYDRLVSLCRDAGFEL